jgi:Fe-S-cluster containining protein
MKERLVPFKNQRFRCLQCGECCRSRNVPLTMEDIKRISKYKDPQEFVIIFDERKLALDRREWDLGCVFLKDELCAVQKEKPLICRLYPVCISNKPLAKGEKSFKLGDNMDTYIYVDMSCKGVGQGEPLDLEDIKEKGLLLRNEMLATDLEALIGWYRDENEEG